MIHEFMIQGYTITAAVLVLQYFFHAAYRSSYLLLARMANRVLWAWCFFLLVLLFLGFLTINTLEISIFKNHSLFDYKLLEIFLLFIYPFGIILVSLLFRSARNRPLHVMCFFAVLLNLSRIEAGKYISWNSLLYGLGFWVLVVLLQMFFERVKKEIRSKENSRLPDRI